MYLLQKIFSCFVIWKTKFLRSQLNGTLVDKTTSLDFSFLKFVFFVKFDKRMRIVNFNERNFVSALVADECVIDLMHT